MTAKCPHCGEPVMVTVTHYGSSTFGLQRAMIDALHSLDADGHVCSSWAGDNTADLVALAASVAE